MRYIIFTCFLIILGSQSMAMAESSREAINRLYGNLSAKQIQDKIDNSSSEYMFLRSFVALYYDYLSKSPAKNSPLMQELGSFPGWCLGDAHLENFGAILLNNGHAIFSINDMDDSGPCPLAADFLRTLVAAKLAGFDKDELEVMVHAYIDTLSEDSMDYSDPIRDLIKEAEDYDKSIKKNQLDASGNKLAREKSNFPALQELSPKDSKKIQAALSGFNSRIKILDIFSFTPDSGGSSGNLRYRILVDTPFGAAGGQKIVFELKGMAPPGILALATDKVPGQKERIAKTVALIQGSYASSIYRVLMISNKAFLLRPLWKGNEGIKISDYSNDDQKKVIKDEVQSLALLHHKAAKAPADYVKAISDSHASTWIQAAEDVANYMRSVYSELKH